jgi:outer membrane protein assembly factor BamA
MKKYLIAAFLLSVSIHSSSQTAPDQSHREKPKTGKAATDSVKKGWSNGWLPAVAYDSDLGIYYGLILERYDYGDGVIYPNWYQKIYVQVSGYSKGSQEHALEWTTYTFIPSVKFTAKLKFQGYKAYPFYGYDGNEAVYNYQWEDKNDPAYKTQMYYRLARKHLRTSADLQDTIGDSKFQWQAGWSMGYFKMGAVKETGEYPDTLSLYENYLKWDIIGPDEKDGGITNSFLAGLIYDTRDRLTNPGRGIFTELNIKWNPSFLTTGGYSSLSLGLIHKQYFTLVRRHLILAYRIWWNSNLLGEPPFYARQILTTFAGSEGFGGTSTLRGVLMQRVVTRDFLLGTAELRARLVNFRFLKDNMWYIGAVAFTDAGRILKPFNVNKGNVPSDLKPLYFSDTDKTVHATVGGGLKLVMNENFVLSAEFAKALQRQDGLSGLYLGLGYQF